VLVDGVEAGEQFGEALRADRDRQPVPIAESTE
jgi:hypothetical protein